MILKILSIPDIQTEHPALFIGHMNVHNAPLKQLRSRAADNWVAYRKLHNIANFAEDPQRTHLIHQVLIASKITDTNANPSSSNADTKKAFIKFSRWPEFAALLDQAVQIPAFADAFVPTRWDKALFYGLHRSVREVSRSRSQADNSLR